MEIVLVWLIILSSIFAVGALIGDHIIPYFKGEPQHKQRLDYANKDWIQPLTSYER